MFNLALLVAVPVLAAGCGLVISIDSVYGLGSSWPIPNNGSTTARGAVVQLTREVGCQWAKGGVPINAIAPGFFPFESTELLTTDEKSAAYVPRGTAVRRFGQPRALDGAPVPGP